MLSTCMCPSINRTRRREMVNPSPVPPYRREVEESACVKLSKIWLSLSLGIPIPVSATEKRRRPASLLSGSFWTRSETLPLSVNLMAFPRRLTRIWRRRFGSPTKLVGTAGGTCRFSRFFGRLQFVLRPSQLDDEIDEVRFFLPRSANRLRGDPVKDRHDEQERNPDQGTFRDPTGSDAVEIQEQSVRPAHDKRKKKHLLHRTGCGGEQHDGEVGQVEVGAGIPGETDDVRREGRIAQRQRAREPGGPQHADRNHHQTGREQYQAQDGEEPSLTGKVRLFAEQQLVRKNNGYEGLEQEDLEPRRGISGNGAVQGLRNHRLEPCGFVGHHRTVDTLPRIDLLTPEDSMRGKLTGRRWHAAAVTGSRTTARPPCGCEDGPRPGPDPWPHRPRACGLA